MATRDPELDHTVQQMLGDKLRESYKSLLQNIPSRLFGLLRQIPDDQGATASPSRQSVENKATRSGSYFDRASFGPETLAILENEFDEAWKTIRQLGNTTITREALASRLLELAMDGERAPGRLGAKAITSLIAPPTAPEHDAPTMWRDT
jgi:hypothetical protein